MGGRYKTTQVHLHDSSGQEAHFAVESTKVPPEIISCLAVPYSLHSEYRNYTFNVDFRLRNSSSRATTISSGQEDKTPRAS